MRWRRDRRVEHRKELRAAVTKGVLLAQQGRTAEGFDALVAAARPPRPRDLFLMTCMLAELFAQEEADLRAAGPPGRDPYRARSHAHESVSAFVNAVAHMDDIEGAFQLYLTDGGTTGMTVTYRLLDLCAAAIVESERRGR